MAPRIFPDGLTGGFNFLKWPDEIGAIGTAKRRLPPCSRRRKTAETSPELPKKP